MTVTESKEKKEKVECFIKLRYEEVQGSSREVILPMTDVYNEDISYRENMQAVVDEIFDEGGFWLNKDTIIPYHRICSFHAHLPKNKFNRPRKRRFKAKKTPIASNDTVREGNPLQSD